MQIPRCTLSPTPLLATLLAIGCGGALPEPENSSKQDVTVYGSRVHKLPKRDSNAVTPNSAPAGARLTYFGGRVVSNMQVVQVLYGTGSYESHVTSTASPSIATFYQGVLNSAYVDWLDSEYNTVNPSPAGNTTRTNQHIGRGSFLRQVQITPSAANNGTTISDASIQAELAAQIQAGHLPAPTHDAAGNNNTYYAIFFPHGKTITQGGSGSCVAGGFCAYHGTIQNVPGQGEVYYGVHPDMQAGSGCDTGCGSASSTYQNMTSVASHEMIETVTDCEVGLATTSAPPLAWYDNTNGEIGDICNAQQGTVVGGDGVTYTVQTEFSNRQNNCIVSETVTTANDFSISANPTSLSLAAAGSGTSTISTATTSGNASTVNLTVSGTPSGASASVSPTSVTSGGSATLTVNAGTAAAGTYTITVTGNNGSASHATSVSVSIAGSGGGGGGDVANGGFEAGNSSGWATSGTTAVVSSGCHGGAFCARGGSTSPTNGDSTFAQTFTASGSGTLTAWYNETCPDTITFDWASITLRDNTAGTTATLLARQCATTGWKSVSGSVTSGHSYTLTLLSHDDNYAADPTFTLFDDVSIAAGAPPPPPTGGIANGGFETGTFSGWTVSGAHTAITTTSHSGGFAAMAGSTAPTNGDSSIAQTFTAPTGVSSLSLYYANNCPDTVTYDWVIVTLKDNTAGTTATVVPKTCATAYAWTNATGSVIAGHSYTLTLTSHDDNFSADPTYTLFDDVTLQ